MSFEMTKTFMLEYHDGVYSLPGVREKKGELIPIWNRLLCAEFVELALYGYHYSRGMINYKDGSAIAMPAAISVIISNEPIGGAISIGVTKEGYYRWRWRHLTEYYRFFTTWHGYYSDAEEILKDFFPDAREDGLDEEKELWILIEEAVC